MRKKVFSIILLLISLVSSVQSEEENGWYAGTKFGWSHFNLLKNETQNSKSSNYNNKSSYPLHAPILGMFLGYEFNPYFSLEMENSTNGFSPHLMFQKNKENIQLNSVQLATKLSYPITDDFHIYSRFGGQVFWDHLFTNKDLKDMFTKKSSLSPSFSLGAEYVFNKQLITRLDYTWKSSVENIINRSVKLSSGDAIFSIGWKFGQDEMSNFFSQDDSFLPDQQYTVLNENINFPFNSAELKPSAYDKLEKLDNDIKSMQLKNACIILRGYSDRIGNNEYNKKLSEDRAYTIKNYLVSKGFSRNKITVQGMGNVHPLTEQVCKHVENRPLLISCLAPDRRVEIEVLSN